MATAITTGDRSKTTGADKVDPVVLIRAGHLKRGAPGRRSRFCGLPTADTLTDVGAGAGRLIA